MTIVDQMNRTLTLMHTPRRIISLVPSLTELLYDFGLEEEVVGITKFCVHPKKWLQTKVRIGGTKQLHIDRITQLNPDFILANKEENTKDLIEELEQKYTVYLTDINTMDEGYDAILRLGQIFDKEKEAMEMIASTKKQFIDFKESPLKRCLSGKTYLYFIWHQPDRVVGNHTYIHDIFRELEMFNACQGSRYPETSHEEKPDIVFLSSEPYPFKEKNIPYFREKYPNSQIILVDGEIFAWYGSRMQKIVPYLEQYLCPKLLLNS